MAGRAFLGKGPSLPMRVDPVSGSLAMSEDVDLVGQSVRHIVGTPIGQRPMRRDFGSEVHDMVMDPNDELLIQDAKDSVRTAITAWEPRISYLRVEAFQNETNSARVDIVAGYRVASSNRIGNQVFPFFTGES